MEIQNQGLWEIIFLAFSTFFTFLFGHNFWLAARDEDGNVKIEFITSDKFPEPDALMKRERIADFRVFAERGVNTIKDYETTEKTLYIRVGKNEKPRFAAVALFPHPIILDADKFGGYVTSEEAENFVAPNFVKGETLTPQRESYSKYAKALVRNDAFAETVGQKLEIVLRQNPSVLKTGEKLKLRILFDGKPIANLRVSSGSEKSNNEKYLAHARTDADGRAEIEIARAGELCFVRTHYIRPHSEAENYEWESFWASMTFRV